MRILLFILLQIWCGFELVAQNDSAHYVKQYDSELLSEKLQGLNGEVSYLTAEFIKQNGFTRISDLLPWISRAGVSTTNGDRFTLSINGLQTNQQQNIAVFINGYKVDLLAFDALNLNTLGVSITDIAYIEIHHTPVLINGTFCASGALNFVTRNNHKGLTYSTIAIHNGNPINDPGAAKFIPGYSSPNVDRIGFVHTQKMGYYGKQFHLVGTYTYQDWFARDTNLYAIAAVVDGKTLKNNAETYQLHGAGKWRKILLEGQASYTKQFGWVNQQNIPLQLPYWTNGVSGFAGITKQWSKGYFMKLNSGITQSNQTAAYGNYTYTLFGQYSATRLVAEFGRKHLKPAFKTPDWRLGYTINRYTFDWLNQVLIHHKPFASLAYQVGKKVNHLWTTQLYIVNGRVFPQASFTRTKTTNFISSTKIIFDYQKYAPITQLNYPFEIIQTAFINHQSYQKVLESNASHKVGATYFLKLNFSGNFQFNFQLGGQGYLNYAYLIYPNAFNQSLLLSQQTGFAYGNAFARQLGINMHYSVFTNFWVDVNYYHLKPYASTAKLEQALAQLPKQKAQLILACQLPARFTISVLNQYQSKTSWEQYDMRKQLLISELPALFLTNISVGKHFWNKHGYMNLTIRNLWNQPEVYTPGSAYFPLRYYITLQFNFEELLKKSLKP